MVDTGAWHRVGNAGVSEIWAPALALPGTSRRLGQAVSIAFLGLGFLISELGVAGSGVKLITLPHPGSHVLSGMFILMFLSKFGQTFNWNLPDILD